MDDAHRQVARVLLDSLSAYDSDASDEVNERAIATAMDELGDLTVDGVIAAATLLLIPLVETLAERDDTDRHSVLAMLRQHVDLSQNSARSQKPARETYSSVRLRVP